MINYVVCDDDSSHLGLLLEKFTPISPEYVFRTALATDQPQRVLEYAKNASGTTIYFLDLKLDDSEPPLGLSLCDEVKLLDKDAYVIIVSAYPQYVFECFHSHAFDFLVKPFSDRELASCVEAVIVDAQNRASSTPLCIKAGSRLLVLDQRKIVYLSRERDFVTAHMDDSQVSWRESYASLIARLEPNHFLQVHKSYIINMYQIQEINPVENRFFMKNGMKVPYSRRRKNELREVIAQKMDGLRVW